MKNIVGEKFGEYEVLSIIERSDKQSKLRCLCRCSCGEEREVQFYNLLSGNSRSCGCKRRELSKVTLSKRTGQTSAYYKHGQTSSLNNKITRTSEYGIWSGMRQRCRDPKVRSFKNYGGRGIKVCERWEKSFVNFYEDMGPRPTNKHSIDRIDPNGNYEPGNCRWSDVSTQVRNRRKVNDLQTEINRLKDIVLQYRDRYGELV